MFLITTSDHLIGWKADPLLGGRDVFSGKGWSRVGTDVDLLGFESFNAMGFGCPVVAAGNVGEMTLSLLRRATSTFVSIESNLDIIRDNSLLGNRFET